MGRVALLGVVCSGLPPPRFRLVPSRHNTPLCRHQAALAVCHQVAQAPPIWGSGINPEGPGLTGGGPLLLAVGTLQMVSLPLIPTRPTSRVRPRPGEKKSFSMHRQDKKRRTMYSSFSIIRDQFCCYLCNHGASRGSILRNRQFSKMLQFATTEILDSFSNTYQCCFEQIAVNKTTKDTYEYVIFRRELD